jgi:hypothetical protein
MQLFTLALQNREIKYSIDKFKSQNLLQLN